MTQGVFTYKNMSVTAFREPLLSPDEVKAMWYELHVPRSSVHRRHHVRTCDTELAVGAVRLGAHRGDPTPVTGYRLTGDCPCRDLVADAVEIVIPYLTDHRDTLTNPPGAARTHLRRRLSDLNRHVRTELGAPARPETVARNRYGRGLPDDFHRSLYVMLTEEAGVQGPLHGHEGLVRRLGERCAAEFGHGAERQVLTALRTIEQTCRAGPRVNIGTTTDPDLVSWWEAHVERPIGHRLVATVTDQPPADIPNPTTDFADDVVLRTLCTTVSSVDDRADIELRRALTILGQRGLLPGTRVRSLLADTRQRAQVITCVHDVKDSG
jgi:hypothetical protein